MSQINSLLERESCVSFSGGNEAKPLWLINKKPKSIIVNYKSNIGRDLVKLSMGDPHFKMVRETQ